LTLLGTYAPNLLELLLDVAHAAGYLPAIGFQLCFSRPARADAAAKLRHLHATAREPWKQILQLRKFYLELAFTRARMAGKDVEDQLRAIDDAGVQLALDVALLRWRKIVIEENDVGSRAGHRPGDLLKLAAADQCCRIELVAPLDHLTYDSRSGAGG
jgi:hypothetical protein